MHKIKVLVFAILLGLGVHIFSYFEWFIMRYLREAILNKLRLVVYTREKKMTTKWIFTVYYETVRITFLCKIHIFRIIILANSHPKIFDCFLNEVILQFYLLRSFSKHLRLCLTDRFRDFRPIHSVTM